MTLPLGVLALQGDVREHAAAVAAVSGTAVLVRTRKQLDSVSGLIIPGGESTTISKLARIFDVFEPIQAKIQSGFPVFGTCAGLILLADRILDGAVGQETFGGLDVTVRRNAFGHQTDSFETDLEFKGVDGVIHAAFIRAPIVETVGAKAEVVSSLEDGRVVGVRQNNLLGISFHPEVTNEFRIHKLFADSIRNS